MHLFSYILFASSFRDDLPVGLALAIAPFILGWLFAFVFHNVSGLKTQVDRLTSDNATLTDKVHRLEHELTEVRVQLTQAESQVETQAEQIKKLKNEILILNNDLFKANEALDKKKKKE
jgi:peptidoglycan hydrolase CwlO-like protein